MSVVDPRDTTQPDYGVKLKQLADEIQMLKRYIVGATNLDKKFRIPDTTNPGTALAVLRLNAARTDLEFGPAVDGGSVISVPWSTGVTGKPTTLDGYGITDAASDAELLAATGNNKSGFSFAAPFAMYWGMDGGLTYITGGAPGAAVTLPSLGAGEYGGKKITIYNSVSNGYMINAHGADRIYGLLGDYLPSIPLYPGQVVTLVAVGVRWIVESNSFVQLTWTDKLASRALGTTYTNTSGKVKYVCVCINQLSGAVPNRTTSYVNGLVFNVGYAGDSNGVTYEARWVTHNLVVPPGSNYGIANDAGTPVLQRWWETE